MYLEKNQKTIKKPRHTKCLNKSKSNLKCTLPALAHKVQGVHKVLHTLKIFISQKPHKVETLHFRQ